jgi:hypothetical protein
MKVRALYPMAFEGLVKEEPTAGDIVDINEKAANELILAGHAEKPDGAKIERATKAPGEKK